MFWSPQNLMKILYLEMSSWLLDLDDPMFPWLPLQLVMIGCLKEEKNSCYHCLVRINGWTLTPSHKWYLLLTTKVRTYSSRTHTSHTLTDLVILFSSTAYTVQETDPSLEVEVQLGPGIQLQRDITLDLRTADGAPPTGATGISNI